MHCDDGSLCRGIMHCDYTPMTWKYVATTSAPFTLHGCTLPSTLLPLTSLVEVERDGDAHVGEAMWCKVISCHMICLQSEKESQDRPRLLECTPRTLHVYQLHTHTQSSLQLLLS